MKLATLVTAVVLAFCLHSAAQLRDSSASPASFVEVADDQVVLKKDLQLVLRSKQVVSSQKNKVGDVLEFEVIRPVVAGNLVVIAKGAPAIAKLEISERAGRLGKGGVLRLNFESVQLVTGHKVPIISHVNLDAGNSVDLDRAAMMGFGAVLLGSMRRGEEATIPKGIRIPAWMVDDINVKTAELAAHQPPPPQPRTDVAYIYLFMDAVPGPPFEVKFMVGEAHYFLLPELAVRIELPPGNYWLRTGKAAKNEKIAKAKPADLFHVALKGGESYYVTYGEDKADKKNFLIRTLPPAEAEEHIEKSEVLWDYSLANHSPETLRNLQAQPVNR
ncbi:MAG TPA: hypothetical protein VD837_01685 [Terriglobales bacterium]|nr:hypothetical protein [Terriglobales bacterium]